MTIVRARRVCAAVLCVLAALALAACLALSVHPERAGAQPSTAAQQAAAQPTAPSPPPLLTVNLRGVTSLVKGVLTPVSALLGGGPAANSAPTQAPPRARAPVNPPRAKAPTAPHRTAAPVAPQRTTAPVAPPRANAPVTQPSRVPATQPSRPAAQATSAPNEQGTSAGAPSTPTPARTSDTSSSSAPAGVAPQSSGAPPTQNNNAARYSLRATGLPTNTPLVFAIVILLFSIGVALVVRAGSHHEGRRRT